MKRKKRPLWLRILVILIVIYVAGGIFLFLFQERLLFHPRSLPFSHRFHFKQPFKELNIPLGDRNISVVKFMPSTVRKGVVLYFHGNRDNVERYAHMSTYFTSADYEVWMIDYPGFGKSTGDVSEKILYADALTLYTMAAKEVDPRHIVLYGRSIGSGIAGQLSSLVPCKQLILETPYHSMEALAKHYAPMYPVRSLLRYHLPLNTYLAGVQVPVTIFHGTNDDLIPFSHAEKLHSEKTSSTLVEIEGGQHNDLFKFERFRNTLDSLLRN